MEVPAAEARGSRFDPSVVGDADHYNTASVQAQDRLVIENADLAIVVKDPKSAHGGDHRPCQ